MSHSQRTSEVSIAIFRLGTRGFFFFQQDILACFKGFVGREGKGATKPNQLHGEDFQKRRWVPLDKQNRIARTGQAEQEGKKMHSGAPLVSWQGSIGGF